MPILEKPWKYECYTYACTEMLNIHFSKVFWFNNLRNEGVQGLNKLSFSCRMQDALLQGKLKLFSRRHLQLPRLLYEVIAICIFNWIAKLLSEWGSASFRHTSSLGCEKAQWCTCIDCTCPFVFPSLTQHLFPVINESYSCLFAIFICMFYLNCSWVS
jgi:hypothetical protein